MRNKTYLILVVLAVAVLGFGISGCELPTGSQADDGGAESPAITSHPEGAQYRLNDEAAALSVTASVNDGGDLSYQWYSALSAEEEGTAIEGAAEASYTPPTATLGTNYYRVIVTNTNGDGAAASVESERAEVTVIERRTARLYSGETEEPTTENNEDNALSALQWIATNAVANGNYTIELTANDTLEPYILNATALNNASNITITLKGAGTEERTLSISPDSVGPLFTLSAGVTLVLGGNITLKGKTGNSGDGLVDVHNNATILKLEAGSKISGNATTGKAGGVYVYNGKVILEGGEISGNTGGDPASGTGGLNLNSWSASAAVSGGKIDGNTGARYNNVFVPSSSPLTLSGAPLIGSITLEAGSSKAGQIALSGPLSGNASYVIDLAGPSYNNNSLNDVKAKWAEYKGADRAIIAGSGGYTLSADDIAKFVPGEFVFDANSSEPVGGVTINSGSAELEFTGGRIYGTVSGPADFSGVTVTLKKGLDTLATANPNAQGAYSFDSQELGGGYIVEVSAVGYAAVSSAAFAVIGNTTVPPLILREPTVNLYNGETLVGRYTAASALQWIKTNIQNNESYTIELIADDALAPYEFNYAALNSKSGVTLTLKGNSVERTLSIAADSYGSLFRLTANSSFTLVLGGNITLKGKTGNSGDGLVYVSNSGTLKLLAGSKITGNSTSGIAGGVYIPGSGGKLVVEGGEISGNSSVNPNYGTGGVWVQYGEVAVSSGSITGNAGVRYSDVAVAPGTEYSFSKITLQGAPIIGSITLLGPASGGTPGRITVTGAITAASPYPIDLAVYESLNIDGVCQTWQSYTGGRTLITGESSLWADKFSLRNFVHNPSSIRVFSEVSKEVLGMDGVLPQLYLSCCD
jgi:hypothetical protein